MTVLSSLSTVLPLKSITPILSTLLSDWRIPDDAKRIVINLRHTHYYNIQQGPHPVEIQLERSSKEKPWTWVFIASFSYPDIQPYKMEVELYFNIKQGWFYQPDISRCELDRPEVIELFDTWQGAFRQHLKQGQFDNISLSMIKRFSDLG